MMQIWTVEFELRFKVHSICMPVKDLRRHAMFILLIYMYMYCFSI